MSIVSLENKQKKLTLTASSFFINHSSPWHIFHTDISEIMQSLNSWIIHAFMKQERNHRKVWETSFKNKVIPALILFLKTYMYRIPHNIHSIFIFMFIEKSLKIIININLHYFPPMCQCQKIKVIHEVMTNSPHWLLENGSHSGKRIGIVPKYD